MSRFCWARAFEHNFEIILSVVDLKVLHAVKLKQAAVHAVRSVLAFYVLRAYPSNEIRFRFAPGGMLV